MKIRLTIQLLAVSCLFACSPTQTSEELALDGSPSFPCERPSEWRIAGHKVEGELEAKVLEYFYARGEIEVEPMIKSGISESMSDFEVAAYIRCLMKHQEGLNNAQIAWYAQWLIRLSDPNFVIDVPFPEDSPPSDESTSDSERNAHWSLQYIMAIEQGASGAASQGVYTDRIVVRWLPVENAVRYCVSASDQKNFNPEQGPRYFWLRSDAQENESAFPEETVFVLMGEWLIPGKVYYFKIQYEVRDPREGEFVGKAGEHLRRETLPSMPIAGTIAGQL